MRSKYIVFDLDDTLYYEIDYLKSAYLEIAQILNRKDKNKLYEKMLHLYSDKQNVFSYLTKFYPNKITMDRLLELYRGHFPSIKLNPGAREVLDYCKNSNHKLGLLTDGRSVTQRNKLKALGIESRFDQIIISEEFGTEKPSEKNYSVFMENVEDTDFFYIGDNFNKDFISPNRLGWTTIALLDKGRNIHTQNIEVFGDYRPDFKVECLKDILTYIENN